MQRLLAAGSIAGLALAGLTLSACGAIANTGAPSPSAPTPVVYAAIGASETYGIGAGDPRQAWPQVFSDDVLPRSAVLHNFGIPGATTAQALHDEVPAAVARPACWSRTRPTSPSFPRTEPACRTRQPADPRA